MTREEVHDLMENELKCVQRGSSCDRDCAKCPLVKDDKELIEAYRYVIKMLKQQPNEDCISKREVLEIQAKYAEYIGATKFWQMRDDIKGLPPVIPQHTGAEIQKMQELEKELNTWNLDDAREDFISDVYNTLDFLPTNEEANRIIDSFDRITSNIKPQPYEDCISRQVSIEGLTELINNLKGTQGDMGSAVNAARELIKSLLPVNLQPKTGHWNSYFTEIKGNDIFNCMECGSTFIVEQGAHNMNYCPNCGLKMREVRSQKNESNN